MVEHASRWESLSEEALAKANEYLKQLVMELDHDKTILRTINTLATNLFAIPTKEELGWYLAYEVVKKLGSRSAPEN